MIRKLLEKATTLIDNKLAILKLTLIEKIAIVMGFCMLLIFAMSCTITILIILGLGLSSYFGTLIGSETGGYFITVGIYIVAMLLSMLLKKPLLKIFAGLFINMLTEDVYPWERKSK